MTISVDLRAALDSNPSGVGTFSKNIISTLIGRRNFDYRFFASGSNIKLPIELSTLNIPRDFIHWPNKLVNAGLKFNCLNLDKYSPKTDLWFLPNLNFVSTSKPIVSTYHDLSFVHCPEFFSPKQRLWHDLVNPQNLAQKSAALIAVSDCTKTDLINTWNIPAKRIFVINPIISDVYQPQTTETLARIKNKYHLNKNFILYLGNLEPRKNILGLIAAFDLLPHDDLDLVLAGTLGYQSQKILAAIKSSPKSNQIKLLGYIDTNDKPSLYAAADIFVYPSFFEGFGLPPLEAVACGTPVIASTTSALLETSGGFAYGIDPYEITNIKTAIENVLSSEKLRQQIISDGQKIVARYRTHNSATQLENVFNFAIGS